MAISVLLLTQELKSIQKEPVEGFQVSLPNEADIFLWNVNVFGPPGTLLEGGYFKASLSFPRDYPYSPPIFQFSTKISHPNIIFSSGEVCISILQVGRCGKYVTTESASELWTPVMSGRTILLSVISLLTEPISKGYFPQTPDAVKHFEATIRKQAESSRVQAEAEGIKVPTTIEEYCQTAGKPRQTSESDQDSQDKSDFYEDDWEQDYDIYQSDEEDAYESAEEEAHEEGESAEVDADEGDECVKEDEETDNTDKVTHALYSIVVCN